MRIRLEGVSFDEEMIETGTCEQCYAVELAHFPTFEFCVNDNEWVHVDLYDYDPSVGSYDEIDLGAFSFDYEESTRIINAIDFADWLNSHEFRELKDHETIEYFLYDLTNTYSHGVGDDNPSNQEYLEQCYFKKEEN